MATQEKVCALTPEIREAFYKLLPDSILAEEDSSDPTVEQMRTEQVLAALFNLDNVFVAKSIKNTVTKIKNIIGVERNLNWFTFFDSVSQKGYEQAAVELDEERGSDYAIRRELLDTILDALDFGGQTDFALLLETVFIAKRDYWNHRIAGWRVDYSREFMNEATRLKDQLASWLPRTLRFLKYDWTLRDFGKADAGLFLATSGEFPYAHPETIHALIKLLSAIEKDPRLNYQTPLPERRSEGARNPGKPWLKPARVGLKKAKVPKPYHDELLEIFGLKKRSLS
ncbi:hypothetical protein MYX82_06835 [Acidobacteria bacterium AH-259-D05]|nr:hypothetical protein [Acidobacteria bacterium AH-259-D05]